MTSTAPERRYCRVYWQAVDDPKFRDVWDNDARLGAWLRLLVAADMAWPASATMYLGINRKSLKVLVDAGLVDLQAGSRYRIHGLDAERAERSESARTAAAIRWHTDSTADALREPSDGNAEGMPSRAEQSRAEHTYVARGNADAYDDPRARANARHMAYQRGDINAEELAELRAADAVPRQAPSTPVPSEAA